MCVMLTLCFVLQKGMMLSINSTRDLSLSVGKFYLPFNKSADEDSAVFSLPYVDSADGGKLYAIFVLFVWISLLPNSAALILIVKISQ